MAIAARRVSVEVTATRLDTVADDADSISGQSILVRNKGTVSVYIGPSNVTTATGFELAVGESASFEASVGDALYGIAASGGQTVHVLETGV